MARWGDEGLSFDEGFADSSQVAAEQGEVRALAGNLKTQLGDGRAGPGQARRRLPSAPARSAASGSPRPRIEAMPASSLLRRTRGQLPPDHWRGSMRSSSFEVAAPSIILHEVSHGWAALQLGDDRQAGRAADPQPIRHVDRPRPVRHEQMRIAGTLVDTEEHVEVFNPYTNKVVGTVPPARPEHVRSAFAKAAAFKPKLTRCERQRILLPTAELLAGRKEEFARADHRGVRAVLEGVAL